MNYFDRCSSVAGFQQVRLEHPVHPVTHRDDPLVWGQQGRVLRCSPEAPGQGRHQSGNYFVLSTLPISIG